MATGSEIPLSISVDIASLKAELAKIPSVTSKEAKAMVSELNKSYKEATKAAKASVDKLGQASKDAASEADKAWDKSKDGLMELGDLAGLPKDQIEKLSKGMAALATPVGLVTVAVGSAAIAIGSMVAGMVAAVTSADELAQELEPLRNLEGFGIAPEALASIQGANDAIAALGVIAKQVVIGLGAEFAPAIEEVSLLLVKFGLMALDAFNAFADGHDILRELAILMASGLIDAMSGVVGTLMDVVEALADTARAAGQNGLADTLDSVTDKWSNFKNEIAGDIVDSFGESIEKASGATGDYDERARELVDSMELLGKTTKQTNEDLKKQADTLFNTLKIFTELDMLVAEGQLAPGTRDIRRASEAYEDLIDTWGSVEAAADDVKLWQADLNLAFSRGEITLSEYEDGLKQVQDRLIELSRTQMQDLFSNLDIGTVLDGFRAAENGLEGIAGLIGGPVAGAIADIVLNLKDTLQGLREQLMDLPKKLANAPKQLTRFVVTLVEEIIPALMDAIPEIAKSLALAVTSPEFLAAILKLNAMIFNPKTGLKIGIEIAKGLWEALKVGWEDFASGDMVDRIKQAILWGFVDAIVELKAAWDKIVQAIKDVLSLDWLKGGGDNTGVIKDLIAELVTLGSADTRFGDAPGVVRAGSRGLRADFAPNDYVAAARTREGLERMVDSGNQSGPTQVVVNWADAHKSFDGFLTRHLRANTQASKVIYDQKKTGRGR